MPPSKQIPSLTTRSNHCPLHNLPSEILHLVCSHLKPTDVANLRLASSVVAPIGLQYLVPEIRLVVAEGSFRKLDAIAAHPVVSKYVTSFCYQADKLEILSEEHWREEARPLKWIQRFLDFRPRYILRSYKGNYPLDCPVPQTCYTKKQLEEGFHAYQGLCDFQGREDQFDRKIVRAMKKLPNLKELTMLALTGPDPEVFEKGFSPGLVTVCQADTKEWPAGLAAMRSLLVGAYCAGLKIERLRCEQVNWRILKQKDDIFEVIKKSLRHLRELSITFSVDADQAIDERGVLRTDEKCSRYLRRSGRLKEFVTSAPDLECLEIRFGWSEYDLLTNFQYVVGDFYWPSLRVVKLGMIKAAEDQFVGFFERHACTIKDLCIIDLQLSLGNWWSVFERMHLVLKLDSMVLRGHLRSSSEYHDFDEELDDEYLKLRMGIESYLLGDGTDRKVPLNDYLKILWGDDCWQ